MPSILDLDPRWRKLQEAGGVIDVGFDHPTDWPYGARGDAPFVKEGDDQLAADLARFGDARYLRAIVSLPIRGSDDHVNIALWAEVAGPVFYTYLEMLDGKEAPDPTPARLASDLSVLGTGTDLMLDFGDGSARPLAEPQDGALAGLARDGISLDQLMALYDAVGVELP
ncbi:hypothetical protein AQS8620_00933 [Aquimixticola soesokkakensis]|uniref:Uncharacterized protein n=1 Tax=Aquimixticola soesokkakensis TaxID=1519096 RepID=A0A1Y5S4P1_9RHOB|nr:DUF2199 domain-containing protein [Aquimixticola soesokkakensis]SLN29995.1 hypothetical protein AQS8620_00933 [Aquimixticola soesokkakensis]